MGTMNKLSVLLLSILFISPLQPLFASGESVVSPKTATTGSRPPQQIPRPKTTTKDEATNAQKPAKHHKGHGVSSSSEYSRWKMQLPFWPRKLVIFIELLAYILAGVFLGQALEVAGAVRWLAIFTYPFLWLGKLPAASGPPFIMSLQSGAIANSMLVSERDSGNLTARELYASVLVVSCLSLFAHLPTFIMPLGMALGWTAAAVFFIVRFGAIAVEILLILLTCRVLSKGRIEATKVKNVAPTESDKIEDKWHNKFFGKVWKRSRRTALRLLVYVVPSFFIMAILEYAQFFEWLEKAFPGMFNLGFLPAQAAAIIPAQAASLYNGAAVAGNFVEAGNISSLQAAAILLVGSLVTSPVRTMKHALPTYLSILGPRTGTTMAISAQILRLIFTGAATALFIAYLHATS